MSDDNDSYLSDEAKLAAMIAATAEGMGEVMLRVLVEEEPAGGWTVDKLAGPIAATWDEIVVPLLEKSCAENNVDPALLGEERFKMLFVNAVVAGNHGGDPQLTTAELIANEVAGMLVNEMWSEVQPQAQALDQGEREALCEHRASRSFAERGKALMAKIHASEQIDAEPDFADFRAAFVDAMLARMASFPPRRRG